MKRGFTLVELAIVLVIIGLLVGGILAAQSMILTAKVNRLITDLHSYEIGVKNFYNNFRYYPGDAPQFTPPGDGDGALANLVAGCAAAPNTGIANFEAANFWGQLSETGMIGKKFFPLPCNPALAYEDPSYAGVNWPYTTLTDDAASFMNRKKQPIFPGKVSDHNLSFRLYVDRDWVKPLEHKMGGKVLNVSALPYQTGLVNAYGLGNCQGDLSLIDDCDTIGEGVGMFDYYIAPQ